MGRMNVGRIVVGGLLAGMVINIGEFLSATVFRQQYDQLFAALNLPPMEAGATAGLVIGGFGVGIILAWLYAAMRPRFGAGARTALLAGLVVWALGWLWQALVAEAMGLYELSVGMWLLTSAWGIVELGLAGLAAGWLYHEGEPAVM